MTQERKKLVELKNVSLTFNKGKSNEVKAIDDVSFDIYEGEIFGLVGESGSGKTTIGRSVLKLSDIDSGTVTFSGNEISSLKGKDLHDFRKTAQMIFQDPAASLNERATVDYIISEGLYNHHLFKDEEERKRKEAEAKLAQQKQEEQRKKIEEQNEKERQLKKEHEAKLLQQKDKLGKAVTNFDKISKMFWHYKDKIAQIKQDIVLPIKNADVNVRNLLSRHKRKINPKFGQLTNSNQQLFKIQNELTQLINDTKGDSLAYHWILNFIAKAVVHQAETEVRVKPESALPLGKLTLYLLVQFPELQELFMARLVKKCPFVIGFTCEIDTEKGRQNMGWKRNNENKWEDNTSYDERMGGILSLFAIITRLQLPQEFITTTSHPFPIALSWHILARICNTPLNLITNTHFVILGSWWDAAAVQFLQAYGNQASKLLILIGEELTSRMAEKKYVGAARLRILLEAWQNNNMESFPEMSP